MNKQYILKAGVSRAQAAEAAKAVGKLSDELKSIEAVGNFLAKNDTPAETQKAFLKDANAQIERIRAEINKWQAKYLIEHSEH